jgi:proteasome accessory factor A
MTMFAPVVTRARSTNTYLTNGSRLYLDVGSHPEYATAEARTPTEALLQDVAGERIMRHLAQRAQKTLSEQLEEPDLTLHVYKNNVDAAGHSFGCHENYLLRRAVPLKFVERALVPFLATRLVWAGAGHVMSADSSGSFTYEIAQRAAVLDEAVSSATTRVRPMVNTRDEPHANPDQFRRLHVIVGDSNRSQMSTWLRLVSTHMVLCMMEDAVREGAGAGADDDGGNVDNQFDASNQFMEMLSVLPLQVVKDPTGLMKAVSRGDFGALRTALAVQRLYCNAAMVFAAENRERLVVSGSLDDSELDTALSQWNEAIAEEEAAMMALLNVGDVSDASDTNGANDACTANGAGDTSAHPTAQETLEVVADAAPTWVEWANKFRLLRAFCERHAHSDFSTLEQLELAYHDIANPSVYENLVRHQSMPEKVSHRSVEQAMTEAPAGTRAEIRGEFVRQALKSSVDWSCDWTHVEVRHDSRHSEAQVLDPFSTVPDDDVRRVFSALEEGAHEKVSEKEF